MSWADIIGTFGVALVLSAYALLQMERVGPRDTSFLWLNMLGSALILVSLYYAFNLASVIIQLSWIAISLFGLLRRPRA